MGNESSTSAARPRGDDHPNRGPHVECLVDHGGKDVPRHCRRGCKWPCPDASVDPRTTAATEPTRDDLIRNLLDMAQKRVEAAKAGPEKRELHPETWTIPHTHYNDVRTNDCGHEIHVGWLEIAQEIENVQQLMDHLGIPDGLPQGKGDADWRVAEVVLRLHDMQERLFRIAQNHQRETADGGMVGDFCVECNWRWPCPSYRFANGDGDALDPWREDK